MVTINLSFDGFLDEDSTGEPGNITPSPYQENIYDFVVKGKGNGIVNAVAGSGKTTTLLSSMRKIPKSSSALFMAFNKSIADEIKKKLRGTRYTAKTIHSLGYSSLATELGKLKVDGWKYTNIVKDLRKSERFKGEREYIRDLVNLSRLTLTDLGKSSQVSKMVDRYQLNITLPSPSAVEIARTDCLELACQALKTGIEEAEDDKKIDFTDMLWLPWKWSLPYSPVDWLYIDECQDLNALQLYTVSQMSGDRVLAVGDPHQAIYGFAGADTESFQTVSQKFDSQALPLSICYRCPSSHVNLAKEIVPQIEASDFAPSGVVEDITGTKLLNMARPGDLIISRKKRPLVAFCLQLFARKIPAKILGRDLGARIIRICEDIKEMRGFRVAMFKKFLGKYYDDKISAVKENQGGIIEALLDEKEAIGILYSAFKPRSFAGFLRDIASLFCDKDRNNDNSQIVRLATVHKAKGTEADRVFVLERECLPLIWKDQAEWQFQQEKNLEYVALTRAKRELYFLSGAR